MSPKRGGMMRDKKHTKIHTMTAGSGHKNLFGTKFSGFNKDCVAYLPVRRVRGQLIFASWG